MGGGRFALVVLAEIVVGREESDASNPAAGASLCPTVDDCLQLTSAPLVFVNSCSGFGFFSFYPKRF